MFGRKTNALLVKKINELRTESEHLLEKNTSDLHEALERMERADQSTHDWRAEASGLAYMICQIHDDYLFAREHLGGDSEFLANAILQAYRWVDGPFRDYFETARIDGGGASD